MFAEHSYVKNVMLLFGLVRKRICGSPGDWPSLVDCWKGHHASYLPWPRKPCYFCKLGFSRMLWFLSFLLLQLKHFLVFTILVATFSSVHNIPPALHPLPQLAPVGFQYKQTIPGNVCALTGIPYTEVHSWGCTPLTSRLTKSACLLVQVRQTVWIFLFAVEDEVMVDW